MARRAAAVGKTGLRLVEGDEPATYTTVVQGRVAEDWETVRKFLNDKDTKGRIRCLKLERMLDALIRGGEIRGDLGDEARLHGVADLVSLKRARIWTWIVKREGTNKARPMYGLWKVTSDDLLWASRKDGGQPAPIGTFRSEDLPHLCLVVTMNWVRDLHTDIEREAQIFDLLKLVSWKGPEFAGGQEFEIVGHDIVVNRDTLELYGGEVRDAWNAAQALKPHAKQLGLPDATIDERDVYEASQAYIRSLGANLFRADDGAVMDSEGTVLYHVAPDSIDAEGDETEGEFTPPLKGTAVPLEKMVEFGALTKANSRPLADDDDDPYDPEDAMAAAGLNLDGSAITAEPPFDEEIASLDEDDDEPDNDEA